MRRQLHGEGEAQQVAAQRGHAAVASGHLHAARAARSKQAHPEPAHRRVGVFIIS